MHRARRLLAIGIGGADFVVPHVVPHPDEEHAKTEALTHQHPLLLGGGCLRAAPQFRDIRQRRSAQPEHGKRSQHRRAGGERHHQQKKGGERGAEPVGAARSVDSGRRGQHRLVDSQRLRRVWRSKWPAVVSHGAQEGNQYGFAAFERVGDALGADV